MTWTQFSGTMLALLVVAVERLLNYYLPARKRKAATGPAEATE